MTLQYTALATAFLSIKHQNINFDVSLTLEVMALPVMRLFMFQLCTKFEVPLSALVGLMTLIFDLLTLKLVRIIVRDVSKRPTNFDVS